jgi:serine/threonine-protein kinase
LSNGDDARRAELERLVAECERDMPEIERPAAEAFASLMEIEEKEVPLSGVLVGRYRIDREIGRGGMARVYLAHDLKHSRNVAVKVIRSDLAASLGRERFLREIAIAASLRHPNIVPLYDSGDADGVLFFVMPYEEGPSLRKCIADRASISVAERVGMLHDIARALVYAHEHGVVHRDIKPDNVMLSGGAAVVTDFGIAKAVSAAQTATSGTMTQGGAGIGTPAYMAPEQAMGDPGTDHRADIYSFGCLAYELFAGTPPFHSLPAHRIITAHVTTKPVAVTERASDVPGSVARLVATCLEKDPNDRPQTAKELLDALEGASSGSNATVRPRLSKNVLVALSVAGAAAIATAGYFASHGRAPDPWSIAVLPLQALGGDSAQGLDLAYGLSDEIAAALVKAPGVRVMSRGGARKYSSRDIDPRAAGKELGARFLVTGSLRGVGKTFKVTASLLTAEDESVVWADIFERTDGDLTAVREEIVASIERALRGRYGSPVDVDAIAPKPTKKVNPEAYTLYILAQRAVERRNPTMLSSVDLFRQAIHVDTLFANAYSGLSMALALRPFYQFKPASEVFDEVVATAKYALHLDPTLAQPHIALGMTYAAANQWDRAMGELRTAVSLEPRNAEARVQYGRYLLIRDSVAAGIAQMLTARDEDPVSSLVLSWLSYAYYVNGQLDSAVAQNNRAYQSDPTNRTTLTLGSVIRLRAGDSAKAREFAHRLSRREQMPLYTLGAIGDTAIAMDTVRAMENARPRAWMAESARAFVELGMADTSAALAALERSIRAKEIWQAKTSMRDPVFDPIRASARFEGIVRQLGLPMSLTRQATRAGVILKKRSD